VEISHEALIRKWGRLSDRQWESGRPHGWVWREFQEGQRWRALVFLAQNERNTLSPGATEQWLPWFNTVLKRPAWARRYIMAQTHGSTPNERDDDGELKDVQRLFERSERHLTSIKNRSSLVLALVIGVAVLVGGALIIRNNRANESKLQNAQAVADQQVVIKTAQAQQQAIANLETSIATTCHRNHGKDTEAVDNCISNLISLTSAPPSTYVAAPQTSAKAGGPGVTPCQQLGAGGGNCVSSVHSRPNLGARPTGAVTSR
jgi:cytochrome c553